MKPSIIEFYVWDNVRSRESLLASVESSMVPPECAAISIGQTYYVRRVTYALDDAGDAARCRMRANVHLETVPQKRGPPY